MADSQPAGKVDPSTAKAITTEPKPVNGSAPAEEKKEAVEATSETSQIASETKEVGSLPYVLTTHPCFPALAEYGPPTLLRKIQWGITLLISSILSSFFLGFVITTAVVKDGFVRLGHSSLTLVGRNPDKKRPFWEVEKKRKRERKEAAKAWNDKKRRAKAYPAYGHEEQAIGVEEIYEPTEGGKDRYLRDIPYYAQRVGLDGELFKVQTEDGFLLDLWHLYNPKEYTPVPQKDREPIPFSDLLSNSCRNERPAGEKRRYPVLLIPGILQTAGVYCAHDEDSFAFYLAKAGYDVWLGTNRCGYKPENMHLSPSNPRHWSWTVQHMGVYDLPALIQRILYETSFPKLALVGHSQGTAQTLIALSKHQRPELGSKISVLCALAPAAYAGSLANIFYFRVIRLLPSAVFRFVFGVHAFIPMMMMVRDLLPAWMYADLAWLFIAFLFNWNDNLLDRDLRRRGFLFSPLYISAENLHWWVGKGGFTAERCILAKKEQWKRDEAEDEYNMREGIILDAAKADEEAWFDSRAPPMAFWVGGSDYLCDGVRLLNRLKAKREPHLRVAHMKLVKEYDHLDVIWAVDAVEKVGKEVRDVIWRSVDEGVREGCREIKVDG